MSGLLPFLIGLLLLSVLAVPGTGVVAMLRGGDFNRKYGNKLMRLRVLLQFAAVILILLAMLASTA